MSQAAARELGFEQQGTTRVRVRWIGMAKRTDRAAQAAAALAADPVASPRTAGLPDTPNARAGDDQWTVQAGAFSSQARATEAARRLAGQGLVRVVPVERDGARLYRVVLGGWRDPDEAARALDRVTASGFADAHLLPAD